MKTARLLKLCRRSDAATLIEMIFATLLGCAVMGGLLSSLSYLYRQSAAVKAYATAEGNQMRISDYLALDVRRCLSLDATAGVLTITIPDYFGNGGALPSPAAVPQEPTVIDGKVTYGPAPVTVKYYQQGSSFYRSVNGAPTVIAQDVVDFNVTATASGNSITCATTFSPSFSANPSAGAIAATSVFTTAYPRSVGAR